ncbi:MAG: DUF2238 domain-containing protein [Phycisphaerales bacterium]|jgi:putative membrane protein|nr:DUF2238 domain-containing protein [Phycisphaerales bacterium]
MEQDKSKTFGILLYAIVIGFLILSVINPHDFFTWVLEVSWIIVGLGVLAVLNFKGKSPSRLLSVCLALHSIILIYGAWYTYELTPLGDYCRELFGSSRNHYDRLGHFAQGFFPAVLLRELLIRNKVVNGRYWREGLIFAGVMAFTAIFEIIEFSAALAFGNDASAYLGSQGDIWDAQWDMVLCGIGGVASIIMLANWHEKLLGRKTL